MRVICKIKWRKKGDAGNNCQIVIFNSFLQTDHLEYAIIRKREKEQHYNNFSVTEGLL